VLIGDTVDWLRPVRPFDATGTQPGVQDWAEKPTGFVVASPCLLLDAWFLVLTWGHTPGGAPRPPPVVALFRVRHAWCDEINPSTFTTVQ
jgi:hypothetical protein